MSARQGEGRVAGRGVETEVRVDATKGAGVRRGMRRGRQQK